MVTEETFVLIGGLFFGLCFGFLCLMAWKVLNTIEKVAGVNSRSQGHERRDLLHHTERLLEKKEFSNQPNIALTHASERREQVKADASVEKEVVRSTVPKPQANDQSDLVNTGLSSATLG